MVSYPSYRWVALTLATGAAIAACAPSESAGECFTGKPCANRGDACDETINECVPQDLDVGATGPVPAPADFSAVALPFFRGRVCMPTAVQPGDNIPVKLSFCSHPCVTGGSYKFQKQYKCTGSSCDAAVVQYYGNAAGTGCPDDVFGGFDESQCVYPEPGKEITASAGPFVINGNPVSGNAKVEVPFLSNTDAAKIRDGAMTEEIWTLINQYPQDPDRVFAVTMSAGNPAAPADCADESKCECRTIGF